jgi:pimeloyl-ACP methyl ester carboxylesterase
MAPTMETPDTILLVHGLYLTPRSWESWVQRYQVRGYRAIAPAWPGMEAEVEALRADPSPIAMQRVELILDHLERIVRELRSTPILMGHSFGGAFVQVLLDRGLGAAGVVIDSAPTRGVLDIPLSTVRANLPTLRNPFRRMAAVMPSEAQFHYAFTNTLSAVEAKPYYDRYAIPGSRNVLLTGAVMNLDRSTPLRVDYAKPDRAPLLFISGGADHVIPPSMNRHNARRYTTGIVESKTFAGRPHLTGVVPGWEAIADAALDWAVAKTTH